MTAIEDPSRQLSYLQQCLSSDKKPLGLFLGAGCPMAIQHDGGEQAPLIPDIAGITQMVRDELAKDADCNPLLKIVEEHFESTSRKTSALTQLWRTCSHISVLSGSSRAKTRPGGYPPKTWTSWTTRSASASIKDDERWIDTRLSLDRSLGPGFRELGELLWVGGYMIGGDRVAGRSPIAFGNDAVVGLAIVTQTAGELCAGAALLLERGNDYGAAALLRQLVEVECLAWAFAEDEDEAADWLRSSRDDRLKR